MSHAIIKGVIGTMSFLLIGRSVWEGGSQPSPIIPQECFFPSDGKSMDGVGERGLFSFPFCLAVVNEPHSFAFSMEMRASTGGFFR